MKYTSSLSAKRRAARRGSSLKTSKTDWRRLNAMKDRDIVAADEHPEAGIAHIVRGIARQGLKPLPRKTAVSLSLENSVLEWFKAQGPGYQTRMNAVLRAFRDASAQPGAPADGARLRRTIPSQRCALARRSWT